MRAILVIIDGLGDRACKQLNDKTSLEVAEKPNLDFLAKNGRLGRMYTVKKDYAPESDTAIVSLLGNNPFMSVRGVFEAIGVGIDMKRGDLCLRANFATIQNLDSRKVIDRRVGRTLTTKEARILADSINKQVKLPCKFIFKATVQHRGVLVLRGGFSDNITNTDSAYHTKGKFEFKEDMKFSEPLDDEDNTKYTANLVNEFIEQSYKILNTHNINKERKSKGLMPANIILIRDAGIEKPDMKKLGSWAAIAYMPLEIGITKSAGMEVFSFPYPEMKKHDVYQNLHEALKYACKFSIKTLKKNQKDYSYFYIHFKETDVPGHDNKPIEKKIMIEEIDKNFFSFLAKFAKKNKIKVVVTADHATPCNLKCHSSDAVPVLICDWKSDNKEEFSEKNCDKEEEINVKDFLKLI